MNAELSEHSDFEKVADLVAIAGTLQPMTAVMAGGERTEDLLLLESARDHGIIDRIVLVGRTKSIARAVEKVGIDVPRGDIIAANSDEEAAAVTARQLKEGAAQMVLKGSTPSHVLHRHMLPLAVRDTVSLVSIFDAAPIANGRPMILTDAGVTTVCNYARIAGLIQNAVDVARHVMRISKPRVALLSANEKILPTLPSTELGAAFARRGWPGASICGPLSLDLATDPGAAAMKGIPETPGAREVAGKADVLVCPNIDAANVIYKMVSALIKYGDASLANIIMGFPKPYVLLSRSDALETRLNSLALGAVYAQCGLGENRAPARAPARAKMKAHRIVVVNPGSTSTKIALYENERCVKNIEQACLLPTVHTKEERQRQVEELTQCVCDCLRQEKWNAVDAVSGRGGFMPRPLDKLAGGVYMVAKRRAGKMQVNTALVNEMLERPEKQHASNLGAPVAAALAAKYNAPAYVVDPVIVDEFVPEAEISGYRGIARRNTSHALSTRAAARKAAATLGRPLEDINLVVAHLGGGVTIAAVRNGRVTDANIALLGGGPFTPQRVGHLPVSEVIDLCYSGKFTREELYEELTRRGGLQSYLGDYRLDVIEERIKAGDGHARLVVEAMAYQIAKEIGAMYVAAGCDVEAIVLTGGMVRAERIRTELRKRVGRLAPILVFDEPLEMEALAHGALRALTGEVQARPYPWKRMPAKKKGDSDNE